MNSTTFLAVLAILLLGIGQRGVAQDREIKIPGDDDKVELSIFWEQGCPYCQSAKTFLAAQSESHGWLKVNAIDITGSI